MLTSIRNNKNFKFSRDTKMNENYMRGREPSGRCGGGEKKGEKRDVWPQKERVMRGVGGTREHVRGGFFTVSVFRTDVGLPP